MMRQFTHKIRRLKTHIGSNTLENKPVNILALITKTLTQIFSQ